MVVLAVLVIVELVVDSSPELGQYADTVEYLPKADGDTPAELRKLKDRMEAVLSA